MTREGEEVACAVSARAQVSYFHQNIFIKIFSIIKADSYLELNPDMFRYERRCGDLYSQGGGVTVLRGQVQL